jgi:hypothetical protein
MDLPKLGIRDTYLFKPKWPKRNTWKVHLKGECPHKALNNVAGCKKGEDFRRKIREYKKIP